MSLEDDIELGLGLGPDLSPTDRQALVALAERLERERPIPAAGFRGELRRKLLVASQASRTRPRRLKTLVSVYAGSGLVLLLIAALGVGGAGPLAAG